MAAFKLTSQYQPTGDQPEAISQLTEGLRLGDSSQILLGFIVGFVVDMFCNTPGLHALTCVTTMWLRLPLLHVFIVADDIKNGCPTYHRLGSSVYTRFLGFVVLVHCVLLYSFESFTLFNFFNLLSKIVMSVVMTFLLVWAADVANNTK